MKKIMNFALMISAVFFCIVAYSATCPNPNTIRYVNGQWTAPAGWQFNQVPEGGAGDQVGSFKQIEWQAIIVGQPLGSINWCQYNWKVDKGYDPISISWWGSPLFAIVNHLQAPLWNPTAPGSPAYICTSSQSACSFRFSNN